MNKEEEERSDAEYEIKASEDASSDQPLTFDYMVYMEIHLQTYLFRIRKYISGLNFDRIRMPL